MEVGVLGPLEVCVDGQHIPLHRPKERRLLAVIAFGGGRPVSRERIVDALWGADPPQSPTGALRAHVRRVRAVLGGEAIDTTALGYACSASVRLDADCFRAELQHVGDALTRAAAIGRALALWRGRPYDDLGDWAPIAPERRHLCELHDLAQEDRATLRLQLGEATTLVPLLEELVLEAPLVERRWELLLIALDRAGRRADALRAFQRARLALGDAGLEPRQSLVELDRAIARGEQACPPGPDAHLATRPCAEPDDAVRRAEAAIARSGTASLSGLNPGTELLQLLDDALAELPQAPTALRARILARLAVAGSSNRDPILVSSQAQEALSIARLVGDHSALLTALYACLAVASTLTSRDESETLAREMLDRAGADDSARVLALSSLSRVLAQRGELEDAARHVTEAERLACNLPPDIRLAPLWHRLFRATLAGDLEAALAAKDAIGKIARQALVDPDAAASMVNAIGMVAQALLAEDDAPRPATPTIRLDRIPWPQANLRLIAHAGIAREFAARRDFEAAREVLGVVTPGELESLTRDMYWPGVVWTMSTACHRLADAERARALYPEVLPAAGLLLIDPAGAFLGCADHYLGLLADTAGRSGDAHSHFTNAIHLYERLGAVWWVARVGARPITT